MRRVAGDWTNTSIEDFIKKVNVLVQRGLNEMIEDYDAKFETFSERWEPSGFGPEDRYKKFSVGFFNKSWAFNDNDVDFSLFFHVRGRAENRRRIPNDIYKFSFGTSGVRLIDKKRITSRDTPESVARKVLRYFREIHLEGY